MRAGLLACPVFSTCEHAEHNVYKFIEIRNFLVLKVLGGY